jgi:hypothetical protein
MNLINELKKAKVPFYIKHDYSNGEVVNSQISKITLERKENGRFYVNGKMTNRKLANLLIKAGN